LLQTSESRSNKSIGPSDCKNGHWRPSNLGSFATLAAMRRAGLTASELGPRQRLPAHGEKMLAYKAEQRLGTGETMRRREFIAPVTQGVDATGQVRGDITFTWTPPVD
jgi:hypothetical protein